MKVRGKFHCESVTKYDHSEGAESVKLRAVSGGDKNAEDNTYSSATPSGEITVLITNKAVHGSFVPGKQYYVDFIPADVPAEGS